MNPNLRMGSPSRRNVSIPDTYRVDFTSSVNGRRYAVSVALPAVEPPSSGYRVFYVLDAYFYFASAVEAIRANGGTPDVVVVGVGYPDDAAFVNSTMARHGKLPLWLAERPRATTAYTLERFRDLTLPANEIYLSEQAVEGWLSLTTADVGRLDGFLETLEADVQPLIASTIPINPTDQAIFGHSLGGLAVIYQLFSKPEAFRTFVAASPSLWWNRLAVLEHEPAFSAAVSAGTAAPRVLITVGGNEDILPNMPSRFGIDPAQLARLAGERRMIDNARNLTARLKTLRGSSDYHVADFVVFPDQGHGISPWPALGRAIDFAFTLPGDKSSGARDV